MFLLSRRDYMLQLSIEDCDICHEPMSGPARTNCRHFYCFECLKTWLESNNTCPTCRAQLFEDTDQIIEQDVEPQTGLLPPVPARRVSRNAAIHRSLEDIIARLKEVEATVSRIGEAQTPSPVIERDADLGDQQPPPPTEQHVSPPDQEITQLTPDHEELSYDAILAYANQLRAESDPSTHQVTFNGTTMYRLYTRLFPDPSELPNWCEGLRTRHVRYTFTVNDGMAHFEYTSSEPPSYLDSSPSGDDFDYIGDAYIRRQVEWAMKSRNCLMSVPRGDLLREVQLLTQEEAENPLEPSILII